MGFGFRERVSGLGFRGLGFSGLGVYGFRDHYHCRAKLNIASTTATTSTSAVERFSSDSRVIRLIYTRKTFNLQP